MIKNDRLSIENDRLGIWGYIDAVIEQTLKICLLIFAQHFERMPYLQFQNEKENR